ncbi:hypothetical protein [Actinophytocola sp.]|uniref:hypothetical protein n=1 Tax=Actinophytocola sp. TaxID=1872138 RepID=UPI002D7E87C3|nr:hypothetical protein [Actinophytocola sp.]HET9140819.1 hypothetical protein [Actinophytocola sp.]
MIIRIDHTQMTKTAATLEEHAAGLRKSIARMKECLAPLYKNWYASGSPTGAKVNQREQRIDEAMGVITGQMAGTSQVVAEHSADLKRTDSFLAGN